MKRVFKKIWLYIRPFLDIKILIIYLPVWFLFSGWAYLFMILGAKYNIDWMFISGSTWNAILWMPFTPEKLVTIPITIKLYVKFFNKNNPHLDKMLLEAKQDFQKIKNKFRRKRE